MGATGPRQKANSMSTRTSHTEDGQAGRPSSRDSASTVVGAKKRYSIWPQIHDREYTDYVYSKLLAIFGAARIQQTGGPRTRVSFWSVDATDDEIARVREMQGGDVSETSLNRVVFLLISVAKPDTVYSRLSFNPRR